VIKEAGEEGRNKGTRVKKKKNKGAISHVGTYKKANEKEALKKTHPNRKPLLNAGQNRRTKGTSMQGFGKEKHTKHAFAATASYVPSRIPRT